MDSDGKEKGIGDAYLAWRFCSPELLLAVNLGSECMTIGANSGVKK